MNHLPGYSDPSRLPRNLLLGILLVSGTAAMVAFQTALAPRPKPPPTPNSKADNASTPELAAQVARAAFYDTAVEPRVFEADIRNREAGDRALVRLQEKFDEYHSGVEKFTNDLTSLGTRFQIVKKLPGQWWAGDQRVDDYVRNKFEQHLFSDEKLVADVSEVLATFQADVDASQRQMLAEIQASLTTADLPQVQLATYDDFYSSITNRLQQYSSDQSTSTVYNALTVLLVSEAGGLVARSVVMGLLARFATTAAVGTAAAGGASAGGAAVGAGGGSFGGPIGTVVGFGVGLAVGLVIDWWMTDKFETEIGGKMHGFLDTLETAILYGQQTETDNIQQTESTDESTTVGLVDAMPVVCDRLLDAYRERFYQQIVKGESQ